MKILTPTEIDELSGYTSDVYLEPKKPVELKVINLDVKIGDKIKRYNPDLEISIQDYHKIMIYVLSYSFSLGKVYNTEYYFRENDLEKYFVDIEDN